MIPLVSTRQRALTLLRYVSPICSILLIIYFISSPSGILSTSIKHVRQKNERGHRPSYHTASQAVHDSSNSLDLGGGKENHQISSTADPQADSVAKHGGQQASRRNHPIDHLVDEAESTFRKLLQSESRSISEVAEAYRKRRGRHPPPGFDKWYQFATERNAIIIEEFWDQIYHDLNPFWALPAQQIREEACGLNMFISIRGGWATTSSNWFWTQIWLDMIQSIGHLLPDMDIALNAMDEPRILVSWEAMRGHMRQAIRTVRMARPADVIDQYQTLSLSDQRCDRDFMATRKKWDTSGNIFLDLPSIIADKREF